MHSYAAIIVLLVPGLLASPMPHHDHDHHSSSTTDAITSAPTPTASSSSTSHWNSQDSAIRSDVTAIGGILQSLTDHATTTSYGSSSSSTSAASSSSTTASSSTLSAPGYQTSQYTGQGGNGQNFGTDGPGPMFDWLADQCGDGECPGSLQYSGGNWPAPVTGQNNGHMDLTIVSSYRNKTVLTDFYLPAFKAFYAANQNSTKQYYDPFPASSHPDAGPLPSMEIISAPGYFGLRRYPANDPTAGPSDWLSITSAYVADDSAAEFLCSSLISLVGMTDPWMGFFGSMLAPVCDEL